tara:strand:- start:1455 stop:1652 length:198 start_codon:yes stop_codon:yes gene_type:complete
LVVEIYNHFIKQHCYILWHNKSVIGELNEDDIINVLDKEQLLDFYFTKKNKFTVEANKLNFINDK